MKKLFLALIALTFSTSAVLYSCGEDISGNTESTIEKNHISSKTNSRQLEKDDFVKVKESTKLLSKTLMNLGAAELFKKDDTYTFTTTKYFYLQGNREDLKNYSFDYTENTLHFSNDNTYQIYSLNNEMYLETPYYKGLLDNVDQKSLDGDKKLNLLIIVLGEVSSDPVANKMLVANYSLEDPVGSCSFWNTKYNVGVGLNAASAKANLNHNIASDIIGGNLGGCTSIGQPESSNFGGVYYATQAWCCP